MDLIIILLLLVVVFFLCITFIPVDINFRLEKGESLTRISISIVWGVIGIAFVNWGKASETRFLLFGQTIIRSREEKGPEEIQEKEEPEESRKEKEPEEKPRIEGGQIVKFIRHLREPMPYFINFFKTIFKSFSIRKIQCDAKLGLFDSAYTGILFGYLVALKSVLQPLKRIRIRLTPVFNGLTLEGDFNIILRISYPIRIIAAAIGLFFKKPVREFIRYMRK